MPLRPLLRPGASGCLVALAAALTLLGAGASPYASAQEKPADAVPSTRPEKVQRAAAVADAAPTPVADLPRDTTARAPRALPAATLEAFRADADFAYDRVVVQRPSLWERFLQWLDETLFQPAGEAVPAGVQRFLLYAAAVGLLAWALLRLLGAEFSSVFRRREATAATVEALDALDAIEDVDLAALLAEAERAEQWRLAVRLRHLRLLQALAARDLVAWAPDKTNRAYRLELEAGPRADLVPAFRDLTRLFEAAWYGDVDVDGALYAEVRRRFEAAQAAVAQTAEVAA